jgi:magnesium transporter
MRGAGSGEAMRERIVVGNPGGPGFWWIDVEAPAGPRMDELRRLHGIGIPVHAIEGRTLRPMIIEEAEYDLVVLACAGTDGGIAEVRCFVGRDWVLTVHDEPSPSIDALPARPDGPAAALDALAKSLVTGLVDLTRALDEQVERLEDGAGDDPRPTLRRLQELRRVVLPQRDVLVRLGAGDGPAPRDSDAARGLRNSAERMAQIGVETETLREALHDATTDRQNEVVRRLTVVAAIFLPLTFLTGFFGQNFVWLVDRVDSAAAFVALGILLPVAAVAGLLYAFHRSGWL